MENMLEKKLRLLLFEDCNRKCRGCCNKDWDLASLPVCNDFRLYRKFLLTGGEPLLYPEIIASAIRDIRQQSEMPIILYTAKTDNVPVFIELLQQINGATITLHTQRDIKPFQRLHQAVKRANLSGKQLRLNVFSNVPLSRFDATGWDVKSGIKWIKNAPLPTNEELMRYRPMLTTSVIT